MKQNIYHLPILIDLKEPNPVQKILDAVESAKKQDGLKDYNIMAITITDSSLIKMDPTLTEEETTPITCIPIFQSDWERIDEKFIKSGLEIAQCVISNLVYELKFSHEENGKKYYHAT